MTDLIDAAPTTGHLRRLTRAGITHRAIATKLGMVESHIASLCRGEVRRVRPFTEECVLSLSLEKHFEVKPWARMDSTSARRRVQALMCLGWSLRAIDAQCGVHYGQLVRLVGGNARFIRRDNALRITACYDRLWNQEPPRATVDQRRNVTKVRNSARRHNYVPPLFWDDDEIDDPSARPHTGRSHAGRRVFVDEVAVERLKRGERVPVNKLEQRTAIAELAAARVPTAEIADRLGMGLSSAIRTRNRINAAERKTA